MRIRDLYVVTLLLALIHNPELAFAYEACGTPLPPSYKGITAFANGDETSSGDPCVKPDSPYGLRYQCVEYVKRFYAQALGVDVTRWWYDAYDFYDAAGDLGLVEYPNS